MEKKIALVTCYFQHNFGSQLQAFATQLIFDKMNVSNETICIDGIQKEINTAKYKYFLSRIWDINTVKDKFATIKKAIAAKTKGRAYKDNMATRQRKFDEFAHTKFHISPVYQSKSELSAKSNSYCAFVVGSDQLWLPSNIAADYYTLNFVSTNIPKIALATSFGISTLPDAQSKMAREFLPRIDFCSVREVSGQKLVKELIGKDIPVVCDPTILFSAEEWSCLVPKERFYQERYIFCYFLGNNPEQRIWVKKIAKKTGFKIVQLQHCDEYISTDESFPDYAPYNVGPAEFIQLIRDAEIVMTDSFHCTVFSLLHKKTFFTFRRYNNDGIVSTNGRLYSLLSLVGLDERLMNANEDVDKSLSMEINFVEVHKKLADLRNKTKAFIENSLSKSNISYDRY